MIRQLLLSAALSAVCVSTEIAAQEQSTWVGDAQFSAIHDMYWRARLQNSYAGNRMCAIKPTPHFDDPKSPLRPLGQRLTAIAGRIETIWPGALNVVARPYRAVPSQLLCDSESAAWEAIFALETTITATERLLDQVHLKAQPSPGDKK